MQQCCMQLILDGPWQHAMADLNVQCESGLSSNSTCISQTLWYFSLVAKILCKNAVFFILQKTQHAYDACDCLQRCIVICLPMASSGLDHSSMYAPAVLMLHFAQSLVCLRSCMWSFVRIRLTSNSAGTETGSMSLEGSAFGLIC